jgi:hypothetical protein
MSLKVIPFMVIIFGLKGLLTLHGYWGTAFNGRVIFWVGRLCLLSFRGVFGICSWMIVGRIGT